MTDSKSVWETAISLLARREHARQELKQKLLHRGADESEVDAMLNRLVEQGYQSDERYTEMVIRSRYLKGQGPMRAEQMLRQFGVADATIRLAMEAFEPDWFNLAREVRERRFGPWQGGDARLRAKQIRFLQGRGFTPDQIFNAFDTLTEE